MGAEDDPGIIEPVLSIASGHSACRTASAAASARDRTHSLSRAAVRQARRPNWRSSCAERRAPGWRTPTRWRWASAVTPHELAAACRATPDGGPCQSHAPARADRRPPPPASAPPSPAPLDGPGGWPPRRPMLPFLLLRGAAVLGDPPSSRLHGLLIVGPLHPFAG